MLWVPGLSLLVFFLVMIPFLIYGFKKGWVYALTFTIVLWSLTLAFIGLNYVVYKYLWKVFSPLIIKSSVDINLDNLSQFYKLQIVMFTIGVESVLIYPMTFLLMFLINKFVIKKHFGHKVKAISRSEKEIVGRRNINKSRIFGSVILTTSGFFSASLIASSLNSVVTPYKKSNFGTNFNDLLGTIYSLGLANNTKSSQIISNFVNKKLNDKMAQAMRQLIKIQSDESIDTNQLPQPEDVLYLNSIQKEFNELFKNDDATIGVFSSIVAPLAQSLNPLAFDLDTARSNNDTNGNIVGYQKSGNLYGGFNSLEEYFNNNTINVPFSAGVISLLLKMLVKQFISFEKTKFYKQYRNFLENVSHSEEVLKDRKTKRVSFVNSISSLKQARKLLVASLEKIIGEADAKKVKSTNVEHEGAINFSPKTISRALKGSGTAKREIEKEEELKRDRDDKNMLFQAKDQEYNDYLANEWSPQKQAIEEIESELVNLNQNLQNLESNKEFESQNQERLVKEIEEYDSSIKVVQERIDEQNQVLANLGSNSNDKRETSRRKIRQLESRRSRLESQKANANREKQRVETNIRQLQTSIDQQALAIATKNTDLKSKKNDFKPIESKKNRLFQERQNANNNYNQATNKFDNQQQKVLEIITNYNEGVSLLSDQNQEIIDLRSKVKILEARSANLIFTTPKGDSFPLDDDESIYYQEQVVKFMKARANQKEEISSEKKVKYSELKTRLLSLYQKWLKGGV